MPSPWAKWNLCIPRVSLLPALRPDMILLRLHRLRLPPLRTEQPHIFQLQSLILQIQLIHFLLENSNFSRLLRDKPWFFIELALQIILCNVENLDFLPQLDKIAFVDFVFRFVLRRAARISFLLYSTIFLLVLRAVPPVAHQSLPGNTNLFFAEYSHWAELIHFLSPIILDHIIMRIFFWRLSLHAQVRHFSNFIQHTLSSPPLPCPSLTIFRLPLSLFNSSPFLYLLISRICSLGINQLFAIFFTHATHFQIDLFKTVGQRRHHFRLVQTRQLPICFGYHVERLN